MRTAPGADHDRHRCRQSQRTRTGNNQHRHRIHQSMRQPRRGPKSSPYHERQHSNANHCRDKPRRHPIGQPLYRRAATLRLAHHLHDLCQQSFAAHPIGPHHKRARPVHRCRQSPSCRPSFSTGIDSPVTMDSSTALFAFEHDSVDRNFFSRTHPHRSPGFTCSSRMSISVPSRNTRAVFGVRSSSARIAAPV